VLIEQSTLKKFSLVLSFSLDAGHEGWHIATNPKAQNLRSVLMQSGHSWTSGLGRTCSE
jgi:hypothetical protein